MPSAGAVECDQLDEIDVLEVWRSHAENVQGVAFACGHFLPEEDPKRTAAELLRFFLLARKS